VQGKSVFIYGSCISRDIYSRLNAERTPLVGYVARSSLASAFAERINVEKYIDTLSSAFQKRMLQYDSKKSLSQLITRMKPGALVIDFIDERFNLLKIDGKALTVSTELKKCGYFNNRPSSSEIIGSGSERHFDLWKAGCDKFVDLVRACGLADRVVLIRTYWASVNDQGGVARGAYNGQDAEVQNRFLDRMYDYFLGRLPMTHEIKPSAAALVANSSHVWGEEPFHYVDRYYSSVAEELREKLEQLPSER
jgi:hypothetical protein